MAEELKTEENPQTPEVKKVEMTQEEFDAKFNASFGKGASKATAELLESLGVNDVDTLKGIVKAKAEADEASKTELQKLQDLLEAERKEKENLSKLAEQSKKEAEISRLSVDNGIQDVEVFGLIYNTASQAEGFDKDAFINGLKETKPYLFDTVKKAPKVDSSHNNNENPNDMNSIALKAQQLAKEGKVAEAKKLLSSIY